MREHISLSALRCLHDLSVMLGGKTWQLNARSFLSLPMSTGVLR